MTVNKIAVSSPAPTFPTAAGSIRVQAIGNSIVLENLPRNARVEVYSLQGKLVYVSGKSVNPGNRGSDVLSIQVQTKGMYVVKAGSQSARVVVK